MDEFWCIYKIKDGVKYYLQSTDLSARVWCTDYNEALQLASKDNAEYAYLSIREENEKDIWYERVK